jgi:hypothetical protein
MNRLLQATTLVFVGAIAALTACASAGPKTRCAITAQDSVFLGGEPVYEDCAVDKQAKLATTDVHPDFRPATLPPSGCFFANVQFVVDTAGRPEPRTARLLSTNSDDYAQAVLATLPKIRYQPARIADRPVRQIVTEKSKVAFGTVRSSSPTPPTGPPTRAQIAAATRGVVC